MVEFEYLRLGGLGSSGVDDLLFEAGQFRIASHPATNEYGVDPIGSQPLAKFGQPTVRRRMQDVVPESRRLHLLTNAG